jgi:hypothetical protein
LLILKRENKMMKFQKDKKFEWMSATAPFEVEFASELEYYDIQATQPKMKKMIIRYEVECFRNFSAYDSPKCESEKDGYWVKANYLLALQWEIEIDGEKSFIPLFGGESIGFETKKGMLKYLDNEIEEMKTGVSRFKIAK